MFKIASLMLLFLVISASVTPMENSISNSKDIISKLRMILDGAQNTQSKDLSKWAYTVAVESNKTTEQFQNSFKREELQTIGTLCADHLWQKYSVNGSGKKEQQKFDELLKEFMAINDSTFRFRTATALIKNKKLSAFYKARLLFLSAYHEEKEPRQKVITTELAQLLTHIQVSSHGEAKYVCAIDLLTKLCVTDRLHQKTILQPIYSLFGSLIQESRKHHATNELVQYCLVQTWNSLEIMLDSLDSTKTREKLLIWPLPR